MAWIHEGFLGGEGLSIGIVAGRFNNLVTQRLLDGALDCLDRHGVVEDDIDVFWVPGAWEIPAVAGKLVDTERYDAIVCLGAVIRGETPHFDYVAAESAKGVAQLALSSHVPVIYGIVTADTVDQALDRAGAKAGNRGWDAALSALEMVDLYGQVIELETEGPEEEGIGEEEAEG
ncbi:6,7-dimethyl-8-ribityllumazine synthase [Candidatus Fermentibacterales bacterium]|nr:6,7-dimethyl-8-ribityllumazine synthase [Candidatus Fermentibacterales bacterium]